MGVDTVKPHNMGQTAERPVRVPFTLSIGITGHRAAAMSPEEGGAIKRRVADLLLRITEQADAVFRSNSRFFAPCEPVFRFVSPLADGADQAGAEAALECGLTLQAVLPFCRETYASDFSSKGGRSAFDALLAQASCVLELPGDRRNALESYVMAGRATTAHCDLLLAIWDGLPAKGRGGTGEVVEYALLRGMPVIHVPPNPQLPPSILWSGFDLHVPYRPAVDLPSYPCGEEQIAKLMVSLLGPPKDQRERAHIEAFYAEAERRRRPRIEYPLLLALTGVRQLDASAWRARPYVQATREEWHPFEVGCKRLEEGVGGDVHLLEAAYCWSDHLAQHFAQSYRSGHVLNFLLAALAVILALGGLLAPGWKAVLVALELFAIVALIANTGFGTDRQWHRRWLDYRNLAERLRPMRGLHLLGLAQPDGTATARAGWPRRWIDWYAAGIWRALGCPTGRIVPKAGGVIAELLVAEEIEPQTAWHRKSAAQARRLDHRLHLLGVILFVSTILSCMLYLAGYVFAREFTLANTGPLIFLTAGLPALGAAIFGIRVQGDFSGSAQRSILTAERLEELGRALSEPNIAYTRLTDLFEEAARTMFAELSEWRLAYQQRRLVIPA